MLKMIPNALSLFRLVAALFILDNAIEEKWLAALIWIILGFLSDLIDGFLARRFNAETMVGKIIDVTADILMDGAIIYGLILTGKIHWWLAAPLVPAIIILRLPSFFDPPSFWFKLGALIFPPCGICMFWLIIGIYAKEALGKERLIYFLAPAISIALLIIYLKRERIITDLKRVREAFFRK